MEDPQTTDDIARWLQIETQALKDVDWRVAGVTSDYVLCRTSEGWYKAHIPPWLDMMQCSNALHDVYDLHIKMAGAWHPDKILSG